MPRQYVIFGRPVPRLGPRRVAELLASLLLFAMLSLLYTLPAGSIPSAPSLQLADHEFHIPESLRGPWMNRLNPWKQPSHPPPRQKNDSDGETNWYANWRWLTIPFSSSVTLDENRSLLPDLAPRTPIYCYYDNTLKKPAVEMQAQSDLLLTWRRAWWAQGFKPVILGPAEAMNNPMYEELQRLEAHPTVKTDVMRWLAWENMGGGLLAHHLLFPMGAHHDALLTFLRRGEFPALLRFQDVEDGLFVGPKADVIKVIKMALASPLLKTAETLLSVVEQRPPTAPGDWSSPFDVDSAPESLAFYSASTIEKKYAKVGDAVSTERATGLTDLNLLVAAHLHQNWQNVFSDGIAVVKPLASYTTHLVGPARALAARLVRCPESPLPASCPPNRPKCAPCVARSPMRVSTPTGYLDKTTLYTIGTVPHPFTTALLRTRRERFDVAWVRRVSDRDVWLMDLTRATLGSGVSSALRVLRFKEAVASEAGASRSLWLTAESVVADAATEPDSNLPDDLDWHFGFAVPTAQTSVDLGQSETPVPGLERRPPPPPADPRDGIVVERNDVRVEPGLLARSRAVVLSGGKPGSVRSTDGTQKIVVGENDLRMRDVIEAWNLADTEAYKFARAYLARKTVERRNWEQEEAKYAGGIGVESAERRSETSWGRWD